MGCSASHRSKIETAVATPALPDTIRWRHAVGARWLLAACVAWLPALPLFAQSPQYTAPGGGERYELPTAESVEGRMEEARWRLGPLRVAPWLGLRGLTYEQDVFIDDEDEVSDVTGSVGAGFTAYLPTGSRVFWIAQAMPEYVFWLDLSERNELIGRYGGGVVADLNRLRLVADVYSREEQTAVTVESPQQVVAQRRGGAADLALRLNSSFDFIVAARIEELSNRRRGDGVASASGGLDFRRVDREEQVLVAGVHFQPSEAVRLGVGAEWTETDFARGARNLSNTGTSPFVDVILTGNKIAFDGRLAHRELEPAPGSVLRPVEELAGNARLELTPGWRFSFGLYGHRNVTYALTTAYSHILDDRLGADVGAPFGDRLTTRAFYETGTADYQRIDPRAAVRSDDVTAYGLEATFEVGEWLNYRAGFLQVDFDSNLSEFDRDYVRITSTFVLSTEDWAWR